MFTSLPVRTEPAAGLGVRTRRRAVQGLLSAGALALSPAANAAADPQGALRPGAVILFQGDSVTDAGRNKTKPGAFEDKALGNGYAALIAGELLAENPGLELRIFNRGISGNKVPDLAARWQEDAIALQPAVLSILVGINDLWHTIAFGSHYKGTLEDYERGYRELLVRSQKEMPGVRLVVCEPFTLREWPAFVPYRAVARKLADELKLTFVPFQSAFDEAVKSAPAAFWLWDGIHPTLSGHALMARTWRKAVGL